MISRYPFSLITFLILVSLPSWAWSLSPQGIQRNMKAKLETTIQHHDKTTRDLAATRQELKDLESSLKQSRELLKELKLKEAETAKRLLEVKPRLVSLAQEVDQGSRKLSKRLRVLYLYGPDLSWWRLASARDFHDALTRSVALTRLAQSEKLRIKELNERRQKLAALRKYLSYRQAELRQIKADKLQQSKVLGDLLQQRKQLSARLIKEQKASELAINALQEALARLARTFDLSGKAKTPKPIPLKEPGQQINEVVRAAEAFQSQPKESDETGSADPSTEASAESEPGKEIQAEKPEESQVFVKVEESDTGIPSPGGMSPPVDGRVTGPAGPGGRGLLVQSRPQAPVRSPWWGRVVYAGVMGGYGHLVVVDHGERVHTVMGYLGAVSIEPGDKVKPGSVLGNLDKAGQLYLEVRKEARPQDPQKWLRLNP